MADGGLYSRSLGEQMLGSVYYQQANSQNVQSQASQQLQQNTLMGHLYTGTGTTSTITYKEFLNVDLYYARKAMADNCDYHLGRCSDVHPNVSYYGGGGPAYTPVKVIKRAIEMLRDEIKAWHGDALGRLAAA